MPVQVPITLYQFSELDERAKERARAKIREFISTDEWWDSVYEDFQEICKIIGIDLKDQIGNTQNGKTYSRPCIWFRGFSSQGDGACFEGRYRYKEGASEAIKSHAPVDEILYKIVAALEDVQKDNGNNIICDVSHKGHYYHEYTMSFEFFDWEEEIDGEWVQHEPTAAIEGQVTECMRDLARWLYKQLESQYDYITSDKAVEEQIAENDYLFHRNGKLFCKVD